jgi:hypothetical protein
METQRSHHEDTQGSLGRSSCDEKLRPPTHSHGRRKAFSPYPVRVLGAVMDFGELWVGKRRESRRNRRFIEMPLREETNGGWLHKRA